MENRSAPAARPAPPPMPPVKSPKAEESDILELLLEEQRKTNHLLGALLAAISAH